MASDIQLYLLEVDKNKPEALEIAEGTASKLESKQLNLLQLIESLGEYLNNEEETLRAKAMAFLAEVLGAVPAKVLSRHERSLLTEFVLGRIESDSTGLGSSAKALIALEERGAWDQETAAKVLTTVLNYTHPLRQFRSQGERYSVLILIDLLMAKYRNVVQNLHADSNDFMSQFISYFDAEKDPRNLMVVFSILQVPMTEWNVESNAKELFDAVFNYFPITFKPPPDDPYVITAQNLKDRLRECIAATGYFAPYAFPELLDKLDSASMNTKRDSLQAITSCARNYGPRIMRGYSITLWDALKFEILNVQEEDLAEEALNALSEIATQLSEGPAGSLNEYLKPVCRECNEHLEDAPTKQSNAAARILQAIAQGAATACNFVINASLPNLFTLYQSADNIPKRRGLTEALVELLHANIKVYGDWRNFDPKRQQISGNVIPSFSNQIVEVLSHSLMNAPQKEVSFRLVTLDGLLQLAKIRNGLPETEIGRVVRMFQEIVLSEPPFGLNEVKTAAMNGLVDIAKQKPQLVNDTTFSAFMAKLPDTDAEPKEYVPVLEAFAKFGGVEEIFNTVLLRLKYKLNAALRQGASTSYIQAILSAVLYALSHGAPNLTSLDNTCPYYEDLVAPLLNQVLKPEPDHKNNLLQDEKTVDLIGRICNQILRPQNAAFQTRVIEDFINVYWGDLTSQPQPDWQTRVIIITWLLASLRKDATPVQEPLPYISQLIKMCNSQSLSSHIRSAALRHISLIVNKFTSNVATKSLYEDYFASDSSLLSATNISLQSIRVAFAITKALVLRNAAVLSSLLPTLLDSINEGTQGTAVARGFTTLLAPDDILTKENHCTISGLHKQKVFALAVPRITASFRSANTAKAKTNHLIALAGVLKWLPYEVISPEVPTLIPLLLQSLDISGGEDDVRAASITTLISIATHTPQPLEEHVGALVGRLLRLTASAQRKKPLTTTTTATTTANTSSSSSNTTGLPTAATTPAPPSVRVAALQCLSLVPARLRTETVLPFRRQVIKMLAAALDDGRRAVRAEAVRCRARWAAVDEVGDEDD